MTVSETLRRAIAKSGQTQYEIAKQTGVGKSILSRFMAGGQLHSGNLDTLANHLGLVLKSSKEK